MKNPPDIVREKFASDPDIEVMWCCDSCGTYHWWNHEPDLSDSPATLRGHCKSCNSTEWDYYERPDLLPPWQQRIYNGVLWLIVTLASIPPWFGLKRKSKVGATSGEKENAEP